MTRRARKTAVIAISLALLSGGCVLGRGAETRTILVDYSHDRFASSFFYNFPSKVTVTPGTTLVFRQTWTGEPHTVTGGRLVDAKVAIARTWIDFFESFQALAGSGVALPDPENPGEATVADFTKAVNGAKDSPDKRTFLSAYAELSSLGVNMPDLHDPPDAPFEAFTKYVDAETTKVFDSGELPNAMSDQGDGFTQNAGQPCYLVKGAPPKRGAKPCPAAERRQPAFDGKFDYYNSGILRYEGAQGNTYRVPLTDDIKPGNYYFYCAVHGFGQSTEIVVKPKGSHVPSEADVARQARKEIDVYAKPLTKVYASAVSKGTIEMNGPVHGPFAGLRDPRLDHALINEFVPKRRTARVGEPVTWKLMGSEHTITFGVPSYFPVVRFEKNGSVRFNPKIRPAAGGARKPPKPPENGIYKVDGGTYDGTGFWSSGLIGSDPYAEFTVRIAKPGTYRYACLIHPPMVGTLVVT